MLKLERFEKFDSKKGTNFLTLKCFVLLISCGFILVVPSSFAEKVNCHKNLINDASLHVPQNRLSC